MNLSAHYTPRADLILFTRQLALMIRAGMPLVTSITSLRNQLRSKTLQNALRSVEETIHDGNSLASGMRCNPHCFPSFYTTLISAGEHAGILDQTLETLGDQLEAQRALYSRLIRAALYPLIVCTTLALVVLFLITWVIPRFAELFADSGVELPWLTRTLITVAQWGSENILIGLSLAPCLTIMLLLNRARRHSRARGLERILTKIPLVRRLLRAKHSSECACLLAALVRVGIPVIEALRITSHTFQSTMPADALSRIRDDVSDGLSLSAAFKQAAYFPDMLANLIEVGELSGNLESMLTKAAEFYRQEVDHTLDATKQLAEPILILLIGLIVGVTVLALYLPIFQLGELTGLQ